MTTEAQVNGIGDTPQTETPKLETMTVHNPSSGGDASMTVAKMLQLDNVVAIPSGEANPNVTVDAIYLPQMDQCSRLIDGPGAKRDIKPFVPPKLTVPQAEDVKRARQYAMEQSIKSVLVRQTTAMTQAHQHQQMASFQNDVKRQQALALMCRVYCGSISVNFDIKEEMLKKAFLPFGPLKAVKLSFDPLTNNHKGFAFIEYDLPEAADLAIQQMNGFFMGGRNLKVTRPSNVPQAQPMIDQLGQEAQNFNRIYITSIHTDLVENDIKSVFGAFGKINNCDLHADPHRPGKHRGFGFIEFETYQAATDAVTSMNMFDLGGQLLRVCMAITPPGAMTALPPALPTASAVAAAAITAKLTAMEAAQQPPLAPPGLALPTLGAAPSMIHPGAPMAPAHSFIPLPSAAAPVPLMSLNTINSNLSMSQPLTAMPQGMMIKEPSASQLSSLPGLNGSKEAEETARRDKMLHDIPQTLEQQETMKISGSDARHMVMQKLMRQAECRVMVLRNMVGPEDLDDDLESEVTEECGKFGGVNRVIIYQEKQSEADDAEIIVKIFVEFAAADAVEKGCQSLNARFFGGRIVTAEKYNQELYDADDLSG